MINENDIKIFLEFYKIRNEYAHNIEPVRELIQNQINILAQTYTSLNSLSLDEQVKKAIEIVTRRAQRVFMDYLVGVYVPRNSTSEIDLSFLDSIPQDSEQES